MELYEALAIVVKMAERHASETVLDSNDSVLIERQETALNIIQVFSSNVTGVFTGE